MKRGESITGSKAQITIFIIIGLIMLFGVAAVFYFRSAGIGPAQFVQPKSPPVEAFIEQCLENTAKDALRAVGEQGGYLTLPPQIAANPTRHVSLIGGVGGRYAPKVPYWYYEGRTEIPSLEYIEREVSNYVQQNLEFCIQDFTGLKEEFDIYTYGDYDVSVLLGEWDTQIKLDWEVDIQPKGSEESTRKTEFVVRLDVPLGQMWNIAKELMEAENQQAFFEVMTINLMTSHPPEDIPFTGLELHCGRLVWQLATIKQKLNRALMPAVAGIRFRNTDHPPFEGKESDYQKVAEAVAEFKARETLDMKKDKQGKITSVAGPKLPKYIPSDSYNYFQYYFNFTDKDYSAFRIIPAYRQEWNMQILATPNQYGILKSGTQDLKSEIMSFLCINTYHFVYDVVYPVVISINYPKSFYGEGYTFRFAFPVQIFHNAPDRSMQAARIIEPTEYDLEYCEYMSTETHNIIARDSVTFTEIPRANLTFTCLRESCYLGETRTDNRHYIWTGHFPAGCYGPVITAEKEGYLTTQKQYDYSDMFYIDMHPTQTLDFEVKRVAENAPGAAKMLEPDMYAIINIEHKDPPLSMYTIFDSEDHFKKPHQTALGTKEGDDYELPTTLDLLRKDAVYDLSILLLQRTSKDEDIMIGGWVGNWSVQSWEIQEASKVIFNVMQKYPAPTTLDDIDQLIATYELMYNRTLNPDVKPQLIRYDESYAEPAEAQN